MREMNARKAFIDVCSSIYSTAISTEINKNGALKMGVAAKLNTSNNPADRRKFQLILKEVRAGGVPGGCAGGGVLGAACRGGRAGGRAGGGALADFESPHTSPWGGAGHS